MKRISKILLVIGGIVLVVGVGGMLYWRNLNQVTSPMIADIPFATVINEHGEEETLKLDIYFPEKATDELRPAIIWFHGGGFQPPMDKQQIYIKWLADEFAQRGYICISPDYRLRKNPLDDLSGTVADAAQDGRLALDWIFQHAEEYGIDTAHMALGGGSAGGILLINMVHDPKTPIDTEDGIFAIIDLWGTPASDSALYSEIYPHSPPTLIIHGTEDKFVPFENSQVYQSQLEAVGIPVELVVFEGDGHTPINRMEEIISAVERFLQDHLEE
jgi:acetyl esterase/lipase